MNVLERIHVLIFFFDRKKTRLQRLPLLPTHAEQPEEELITPRDVREAPEPALVVLVVRVVALSDPVEVALDVRLEPELEPGALDVDCGGPAEERARDEYSGLRIKRVRSGSEGMKTC